MSERRELIYSDERNRYEVFRVFDNNEECSGKQIWVCCCKKEFKQHKRFVDHNCDESVKRGEGD